MADRTRTVVVARFTVEVEIDAEAWARLTRKQRTEVTEEAEEYLDLSLSAIREESREQGLGFGDAVHEALDRESQEALGDDRAELTWDSEDVSAVARDPRPEHRD